MNQDNFIPIIIGNCSPFRIITRESDKWNPTLEEIADIKTAVSEAVTNSIGHGYRHKKGKIELTVRLLKDREIYIKIRDKGCGIADIKQAMEPLFTTAPEEERSGLGFSVMESFMDRLQVKSQPEKGTTVIMRKRLGVHGD